MKELTRDYATFAFRLYKQVGGLEKYTERLRDEALARQQREISSGISNPTEAELVKFEDLKEKRVAEINDLVAVDRVLDMLGKGNKRHILKAIEMVYFEGAEEELKKGDIEKRVHKAVIFIPASERSIYRWLRTAREMFAIERGLRIY